MSRSHLLSGLVGGLLVLAVGAVLLATGVIDSGGDDDAGRTAQPALARPSADSPEGGRTVADIYRREGEAVVFVEARGVSDESIFGAPRQRGTATGSGFVVDRDGTVVTNDHVVEGASDITVRFKEDGPAVDAELKGRDPSTDLAVLQIDRSDMRGVEPMPLGSSSKADVGDPVVAIGNPFGFTRTVTSGIISAKQRQITAPNGFPIRNVIQTDASINPGNSGGPLLDGAGEVIGVNSQIATGGGQGNVGIAFAVPVDTLKELLPRLKRGGKIERPYLGVEMAPVTPEIARELDLTVKQGALLQSVVPGGPAADAGLRGGRAAGGGIARGGDVLVRVDGKRIESPDDVAAAIAGKAPGDEVEVDYVRGEDRRSVTVKLAKRPEQLQASGSGQRPPEGGEGLIPLP